ncbi:MAG: RNA polymerase sigma factor (sigma-70 family) [Saprospiraceae bacterium]|jgi:RNA polymerase sigma factor (sigma-70 family)
MYKNYLPFVSKHICSNAGSHDDTRDVFQIALMVLYKQVQGSKFVLTASIMTYIFSICRYQWLKIMRKDKKVESLAKGFDLQDMDRNVIVYLEKAERYLVLQYHISKFNSNNQKILELHFQKYSTDEIAKQLGLSRL